MDEPDWMDKLACLVYSDWLLERGDIAKASLARWYGMRDGISPRSKCEFMVDFVLRALGPKATNKERRRVLRDAYPFGDKKNWPYKVWCRCVREAMGLIARKRRSRFGRVVAGPVDETPLFD